LNLIDNFLTVKKLIREYEDKYHIKPNTVSLLIASKGRSIDQIASLYQAGQHRFGESYLQEALPKMAALPQIEWHFIGPIQSNKTRKIAENFAWVHSVDNRKVVQRLNEQRPTDLQPLNICIEVNVGGEASKSGVDPADLLQFADYCSGLSHLKLRGLMCIPKMNADFAEQRKQFHQLFLLHQKLNNHGLNLDTLSMGMSADFEAAIAEGSTIVRIGTAIFYHN
jgi:PLP dependent protein